MLSVTEPALKHLASRIDDVDESRCFRMVPQETDITLTIAEPEREDTTFEFEGRTVLALPPALAEACADRSLDINAGGDLVLV